MISNFLVVISFTNSHVRGICLILHLISALKSLECGLQGENKTKRRGKKLLVSTDNLLVINPDCGRARVEHCQK